MDSLVYSEYQLNLEKYLASSLSDIYGIGLAKAFHACFFFGLNPYGSIKRLTLYQFACISLLFKDYYLTGSRLKNTCFTNLRKLIENNSYKGLRYVMKLPMHGQRTSTNAKTSKKRHLHDINYEELIRNVRLHAVYFLSDKAVRKVQKKKLLHE